jgi:acetyl esterase/lipase
LPHERAETAPLARDLVARGYAVLNIEYRRVGELGGGWPGTMQDVAAAIDHLASLVDGGMQLDLDRVVVAGHSAGGQLALWSGCRTKTHVECRGPSRVLPFAVAGLASGTDLIGRRPPEGGKSPVTEFIGGTAEQYPDRYAAISPLQLLPLGTRQFIVHGTADDALPIAKVRDYVDAARRAGDEIDYVEVEGAGHLECLDPHGRMHAALCGWLARLLAGRTAAAGIASAVPVMTRSTP